MSQASRCGWLNVEDDLGLCLRLLDTEPTHFPRIARRWAARALWELPLSLDDCQGLLRALDRLACAPPPRSADDLLLILEASRLRRAAYLVRLWQESSTVVSARAAPDDMPLS